MRSGSGRGTSTASTRRSTPAGAACTRACWRRVWCGTAMQWLSRQIMDRALEPELMDDDEQALAYAKADFEEENQSFVDRFLEYYPDLQGVHVLDLGWGP